MMSIKRLIFERWGYRQIEVKSEIVVDSFLIRVGCLCETGWEIIVKRETVPVYTVHRIVFYFLCLFLVPVRALEYTGVRIHF
jgi:hypothetical protein